MSTLYHLLVWDEEITPDEDIAAHQQVADETRPLFRELWTTHDLSNAYLMGSPDTDADTALDGLIGFLRHTVGDGERLHPIVGTPSDIALLRLSCASPEPTLFFPRKLEISQAVPFPLVAEVVAAAALIYEADMCEERLERVYQQLNHMFGVADSDGKQGIRRSLYDLFLGLEMPDEEKREGHA